MIINLAGGFMAREVIVKAKAINTRKKRARIVRIALLLLLLLLIVLYIILEIIYHEGRFTVTLDSNESLRSGLAIFDSLNNSQGKRKLTATPIRFMDNISYKWLPENIDKEAEGSHNGDNYIAYTFFVENQGNENLTYWYEVIVDDVVKNVDEAIRIRIYRNDEQITYAKRNHIDNEPEPNTTPFKNIVEDGKTTIILEQRSNFMPEDLDRYTVVVWLEGDDPDCNDPLIGGELKMHMVITESHIEQDKE